MILDYNIATAKKKRGKKYEKINTLFKLHFMENLALTSICQLSNFQDQNLEAIPL